METYFSLHSIWQVTCQMVIQGPRFLPSCGSALEACASRWQVERGNVKKAHLFFNCYLFFNCVGPVVTHHCCSHSHCQAVVSQAHPDTGLETVPERRWLFSNDSVGKQDS